MSTLLRATQACKLRYVDDGRKQGTNQAAVPVGVITDDNQRIFALAVLLIPSEWVTIHSILFSIQKTKAKSGLSMVAGGIRGWIFIRMGMLKRRWVWIVRSLMLFDSRKLKSSKETKEFDFLQLQNLLSFRPENNTIDGSIATGQRGWATDRGGYGRFVTDIFDKAWILVRS